jgi:twinkle protein
MSTISDAHMEYLTMRGIDIELASKLGVHSDHVAGSDSIAWPYIRRGKPVGRKHRLLHPRDDLPKFIQDKGTPNMFWNEDVLRDETLRNEPLIITEGEPDAVIAIQCDYPRTVSVPNGAAETELDPEHEGEKYRYLYEAMPLINGAKDIVLATDGDGPGINLMHDLAVRLQRSRCKYIVYPKRRDLQTRCKDLNEVYLEYGQRGVRETIRQARWVQVDGVYQMSELPPLAEQPVHKIGYDDPFDEHFKVRRGDLLVTTGKPGFGKTTAFNDIACRLCAKQEDPWRVAWCSLEQKPQTDHKRVLRRWHFNHLRMAEGLATAYHGSTQEIDCADAWIDDRMRFIVPKDDQDPTVDWFMEMAQTAALRHACDMVVLDPWNELDHIYDRRNMNGTEYVEKIIKRFRRMARSLNFLLAVVAHPAKPKQHDAPISLYSISDSAHWYNKPELGLVIDVGEESNQAIWNIEKVKYGILGRRAMMNMRFDPVTMHYNCIGKFK